MKKFERRDFLLCLSTAVMVLLLIFVFHILMVSSKNHSGCPFSTSKMTEQTRPHSPYLLQRDTMDNGFSRNWMPHFLPSEEYWVDIHAHLSGVTGIDDLQQLLNNWFAQLDAYRLGIVVAITGQDELFDVFGETVKKDPRFAWIYQPNIDNPSSSLVREAVQNGASGLKIHNVRIIEGKTPRDIWKQNEWQEIFSFAEQAGIPILWHVTQRHGYSPYHGGGLYAYWEKGWTRGVTFTNEDLLQDILAIMRHYPKLKVIGAHQLHIGPERLQVLFNEYENLYIDSSCGMYLRWADEFIEADRLFLRDFVEKWSERILFGTDASFEPGSLDEYAIQGFLCHARFMLKLGLNDKALQDVAWRTSSNLLKLPPVSAARRGNVRP